MRKLKSKVEICKLPTMTPVFLPRYREARKLPPSPRWSPSQGIPLKGQTPSQVTLWIAPGLPHVQVGFRCAFRQASPGPLPTVFTIKLPAETPRTLFPPYTVAATPQTWLVWSRKTYKPHRVQQWCAQAPRDKRCANLTK